jgi:UDP-N-acetylglucosamine transferase subunit ALG13
MTSPTPPLVVAVVGTDHHPFDRMVRWMDAWAAAHPSVRVVVQYGTSAPPATAEGHDVLPVRALEELLGSATAVVCHGGPGTVMGAREAGHLPIVVARDPVLGEHVDAHQQRFAARLAEVGQVRLAETEDQLSSLLDRALEDAGEFRVDAGADAALAATTAFGGMVDALVGGEPVAGGTDPLRILYIAGWGRSGSTLLDRMLGQLEGVFSCGELRDIWQRGVVEDRLCGCGEVFSACPVWTKVGEEAFGGWDSLDVAEAQRLREKLDRPWSPPVVMTSKATPGSDADVARYVELLTALYHGIQRVTGAKVIVDSSKIPTYALLLRQIPEVDLRVLHLVRDPRGVVFSWQKRVTRADGGGLDQMLRYGTASASARYVFYNLMAHGMRPLRRTPYRFLRYEDLIAEPEANLRQVFAHAGVATPPNALDFLRGHEATLEPNHTVDGNPMRLQQGPIELRIDDGWRTKMPANQRRVVSAITAPLALLYGYRKGAS